MSEHPEADMLEEYALGLLDAADSARVATHLRRCTACRGELSSIRAVFDVMPHALQEQQPDAAVFERIAAAIGNSNLPPLRAPRPEPAAAFANPLVRALAAALVLAVAADAWFFFRSSNAAPQVARATPAATVLPRAVTPAPASSISPSRRTSRLRRSLASGERADSRSGSGTRDRAFGRRARRGKIGANAREQRSRVQIERLERTLASTRSAVRIVYVTPPPFAQATPVAVAAAPSPAPAPSPTRAGGDAGSRWSPPCARAASSPSTERWPTNRGT